MRKLGYSLIAVVAACGLANAQDAHKKTQTKVSVEDGRSITATGCIERNADGGFTLTNAANKDGSLGSYLLASDDDDLKDHVGHRVEITGKAADRGKGRIKAKRRTKPRAATATRPRRRARQR